MVVPGVEEAKSSKKGQNCKEGMAWHKEIREAKSKLWCQWVEEGKDI